MTHGRAVAAMVLVTVLWSIAGVVTRHLDSARSFEVTFWRSFFNAVALAVALTAWRGAALWRQLPRSPRAVWVSGACWGTMYTAFMIAMTMTSVANVLVTMAIGPLITALLARLFLGQRLPTRTWVSIAVGGIGIGWMFGQDASGGMSLPGSLVASAVPLAAAINWIILQRVGNENGSRGIDMLPAVLIGALLSAVVTLPLAFPFQASAKDIGLLAMLGVVQLAIPCFLVVRLSRVLPAPEISLLGLLEVVFGVLLAWLGAGEQPTAATLTGGALVLAALAVNETIALRSRSDRAALETR